MQTATQTNWWEIVDWRILLLAFGGLSIVFTLISMGVELVEEEAEGVGRIGNPPDEFGGMPLLVLRSAPACPVSRRHSSSC